MKKVLSLISLICVVALFSVSAQENQDGKETDGTAVKVYYFHATHRCATCNAVESVSKEAIQEFYADKVSFESINREENADHPLVTKHEISGQTLLIVKGDKAVDLTNDAFFYARTKPAKLKKKIKSTIDKLGV